MGDLALNHIIPSAIEYMNKLTANINSIKATGLPESACASQMAILKEMTERVQTVYEKVHAMVEARKVVNNMEDTRTKAIAYCSQVKEAFFDNIRYQVDKLEQLINDELWTLPKYREMLLMR